MPCHKGASSKTFLDRAEDIAVRMGMMKDTDRVGRYPIEASSESGRGRNEQNPDIDTVETAMTEKQWLEGVGDRTIEQVMQLEDTHRIDSIVLAIEAALLEKADLTPAERIVVVIEAMEREVGNGGFNQFFYNSSNEYAGELVSALRQIGIRNLANIAERAMRAIGAQPGWTYEQFEEASVDPDDSTMAELNACDDAYYATEDAVAARLFEFIKANRSDIRLGAESEH